jgi:hypothetical protein
MILLFGNNMNRWGVKADDLHHTDKNAEGITAVFLLAVAGGDEAGDPEEGSFGFGVGQVGDA